jgi:DNA-binding response OmpR family regulator
MKQEARILVADNSTSFRMFIEKVLAEVWAAATLTFCRDGMEVLEYFEESSQRIPCLVLLDLGSTSFDVLKWLREQRRLTELPVIIWSSIPLQREKELATQFRATDYMKKPDTFSELLDTIRAFEQCHRCSSI